MHNNSLDNRSGFRCASARRVDQALGLHRNQSMSDEELAEKKQIHLSYFGPEEWFKDKNISSFWLRIYTSLFIPHDKFIPSLKNALKRISLKQPVALSYAVMDGLKVPVFQHYIYALEDGKMIVEINSDHRELKTSNYVFISTQ